MKITRLIGGIAPTSLWRDSKCLFILTTGRVGTVTTIEILNLFPEIRAFHEPYPRLKAESKAASLYEGKNPDKYLELFLKARGPDLAWARIRRKIYAEATYMIYFSQIIHDFLPNSMFWHIHRHPGEFVRSGMRRGWYANHPNDEFRLEPRSDDSNRADWENWNRFSKIAWVWHAVNDYILDFGDQVGKHRFLSSSFERLMDFDSGEYCRVFDFVGVTSLHGEKVRKVLSTKQNVQITGEFPKVKEWPDEMKQTLNTIAGKTMKRLGYSL